MQAVTKTFFLALAICFMGMLTGCGAGGTSNSDSEQNNLAQEDNYQDDSTEDNFAGNNDTSESAETSEPAAASYDVTISWDIPTRRVNGADLQLSEIDGYRIFYYREGDSGPKSVYVDSPTTSSELIENLEPGSYQFKVSAVDTDGLNSDYSQVLAANLM